MPSLSPRSPSLRRQRREVPVPHTSPFLLLPDPDDLDTRRRDPSSRVGTSVPEVSLALDVIVELDPLIGVRELAGTTHLMSAQRG